MFIQSTFFITLRESLLPGKNELVQ